MSALGPSIPDYNRAAEESVLACVLSAGGYNLKAGVRIVERVQATGLTADDFWLSSHRALWRILAERAEARQTLDPVSVAAAIEDEAYRRLEGLAELALTRSVDAEILRAKLEMLAAGVVAFSNVEQHAAIVRDRANRRRADAA